MGTLTGLAATAHTHIDDVIGCCLCQDQWRDGRTTHSTATADRRIRAMEIFLRENAAQHEAIPWNSRNGKVVRKCSFVDGDGRLGVLDRR